MDRRLPDVSNSEIFVVGTSQAVAPAAVRERLHVEIDEIYEVLDAYVSGTDLLEEAVPLATCGRLELYGVSTKPERAAKLLTRLLQRHPGVSPKLVLEHSYVLRGPQAVSHLFRVAAGLDSVVHGEAQILGQVRAAAHEERAALWKGPMLHRLFDAALATGKRVRTETDIGRGGASLASAGLEILRKEIGSFASVTALVVGAGDTGALVSRLLRKAGVGRLIIANRTAETACEVAEPLDGECIALEEIPGHLSEIDLAIGAATLSRHVLTPDMLTRSGGDAVSGPLRLLDLAHPRNFDPQIAEIEGVHLIDLDHVFDRVEQAKAARAAQLPQAEIIVKAKVEEFDTWFRSRSSINILRAVREHVLELAMDEAERFSRGRTDEEQEQMRRLARSLARTLHHHPTIALRTADPVTNDGRLLLESAPVLFGVQPQSD